MPCLATKNNAGTDNLAIFNQFLNQVKSTQKTKKIAMSTKAKRVKKSTS
jgi:hypothetical protein